MRTGLWAFLLLATLVALTLWMNRSATSLAPTEHSVTPDETDYVIRGFTARLFSPQGQVSQTLHGETLSHFPYDGRHSITRPIGLSLPPEEEQATPPSAEQSWKITSDNVVADKTLSELLWTGNVTLLRPTADGTIELKTPELIQYPQEYIAQSDKGVAVNNPLGQLNAQEMRLNTRTDELELKGNVNAQYQQIP